MTSPIYPCNRLMKVLKPYLERGETHYITEDVLKVVNQLDKNELAYIMAKYVACAELVGGMRMIKVGNAENVRKHLGLQPKEFSSLAYQTSQRVMKLYRELNKLDEGFR